MSTATAAPPKELAIAADLRIITQELANVFVERREQIETILISILSRSHVFLLGPPGTAKSAMIEAMCNRFDGAEYFRVLMDKQLPKDDLFGEIDIEAYEKGNGWQRSYHGTAATCHLGFFDEVGKSGPSVLNALLTLFEENRHKPGKVWLDANMIAAIGASNETIESEEGLQAVWDRFLVRLDVDYIQEPGHFAQLLKSKIAVQGAPSGSLTANSFTTVSLADLLYVIDDVIPYISVPDAIWDRLTQLRSDLRQEQIKPSDRRWAKCVRILQASAFFNGRSQVDDDDLLILRHVLWSLQSEKTTVRSKVMELGSPVTKAAMELTEALDALEREIASHAGESRQQKAQYGGNASYEAGQVEDRLKAAFAEAEKAGRSTVPLESVEAQLKNVRYLILVEYLRIAPDKARAQVGI